MIDNVDPQKKKKLHPSKFYITKAEDDQQCNHKRTDDLTTL